MTNHNHSDPALPRLWLARHGETAWSKTRRHTGRTDVPLTPKGEQQARALRTILDGHRFERVLSSPLVRASETCRLAGFAGDIVHYDDALQEWDYGDYEGRTTQEIRRDVPGWTIWSGQVPGGESIDEVRSRVDRFLKTVQDRQGDILIFAHGHLLRVLTARYLGLDPACGRLFILSAGSLGILGHEHAMPAVAGWNLAPTMS